MKRVTQIGMIASISAVLLAWVPGAAASVSVYVKYRGPVDLAPFQCETVKRSSVISQLCYDPTERYVIVALRDAYYHYCDVPPEVVASWRGAQSMGRFYNANVKGRYDCRTGHVPRYGKKG